MPLGDSNYHLVNNNLIDFNMAESQDDFLNPPQTLTMSMQPQLSTMPLRHPFVSSESLEKSFQEFGYDNDKYQGGSIGNPMQRNTNVVCQDDTALLFYDLLGDNGDFSFAVHENMMGLDSDRLEGQKFCSIVAKSSYPLQKTTAGIENNRTLRGDSRKRGRRGPMLPHRRDKVNLMRQLKACVRCAANNIEVSAYLQAICLVDVT